MKAILGMLALLALAGSASATFDPWYYQTLYKWRCFVPGCDQCAAYNPYMCEACSAGYILLKDNTCGCAPGFGSYVQPPMSGYPWLPPQSCPIWVKSSTGRIAKGVVRTTLRNGQRSAPISLKTWYNSHPAFCAQSYYPWKSCQGGIPVPSIGYCRCFPCPTGTNSTGGAITTMAAGCTPGAQTVTRCKNAPPAIPNAKPWNPTKCLNLKQGKACRTTCATGFVPEPAGTNLTAACTKGGVWQTTGACAAVSAVCKGSPDAGANANPFKNCVDGAADATCTSSCADGFDGEVSATCDAASGEWVVTNTCAASGAKCAGAPSSDGATFLDDCIDLAAGATCDGTCADGSAITASCGADGQWTVEGTCAGTGVACPGAPTLPDTAAGPFGPNQNGGTCEEGAVGDACQAECAAGFTGSIDAICLADGAGWSVVDNCVQGGGGGASCDGTPPDATADGANPWPESCAGTALDGVCQGSCADAFNSEGSYALSYCIDDGAGGAVWENDVICTAAKKKKKRGAGH